jgi:hypothetical protein
MSFLCQQSRSAALALAAVWKNNHQNQIQNNRLKKIPSTFGLSPRGGGNKGISSVT